MFLDVLKENCCETVRKIHRNTIKIEFGHVMCRLPVCKFTESGLLDGSFSEYFRGEVTTLKTSMMALFG